MGPSTAPSEAAPLTAEVGSVPLPAPFSPARRGPSSSSSSGGTPAPVGLGLGGRGLGPQPLDLLGAAGQVGVGSREIRGIRFCVEVAVCEGGSHRQPTLGTKPQSAEQQQTSGFSMLNFSQYINTQVTGRNSQLHISGTEQMENVTSRACKVKI